MVCTHNENVNCLWINAGASTRGQWEGYAEIVKSLASTHPNLYFSFTPDLCAGKVRRPSPISQACACGSARVAARVW